MRFSVFTVSLPEWTPEEAVEHLAALGYDGVEWRVVDQPQSDGPPGFWSGNRCTLPLRTLAADAPRVARRSPRARVSRYRTSARTCPASMPDAVDRALARRGGRRCTEHPRPGPELRRPGPVPPVA